MVHIFQRMVITSRSRLEVEGCKVTWEQLRSSELSPIAPSGHARGFGHTYCCWDWCTISWWWETLLVECAPPPKFLEHFSGYVYHFPAVPLSTIERILAALNERLFLRSNRVAERKGRLRSPPLDQT